MGSVMFLKNDSRLNIADLFVLSSFAIAQPIYDLVARTPEFLVAHRLEPLEIGLLIVILSFGVPLILLSSEWLLGLTSVRIRRLVHTVFVCILLTLILLPLPKKVAILSGALKSSIVLVVSSLLAFLYMKYRTARRSLLFLLPAVALFPTLFLSHAPIRKQLFIRGDKDTVPIFSIGEPVPIVMIVFDEFPLSSLMDEKLNIDPDWFPNFAAFSRGAIWFKNASAVTDGTLNSVPGILSGLYPQPERKLLPNTADYPRTLFTLLGENYQFHVQENNTRLCPRRLCGEKDEKPPMLRLRGLVQDLGVLYLYTVLPRKLTNWLPDITLSWGNFAKGDQLISGAKQGISGYGELNKWVDRPHQFSQFVDSVLPSDKPTLHFLHILLPHAPWEFLPNGKKYSLDTRIRGVIDNSDQKWNPFLWSNDYRAAEEAYQRHLLQVVLVDKIFGSLVKRLQAIDLYDRALIVVVADHGCSFRSNDSRRRPTQTNYPDILNVPFFVKLPFQKEGRTDDRNVETIDVLPTIADVLKIQLPWKIDGRTALTPSSPQRNARTFVTERGEKLSFPPELDGRREAIKQKFKLFGRDKDTAGLFKMGPHQELLGRKPSEAAVIADFAGELELDNTAYLHSFDSKAPVTLTHLTGRIQQASKGAFQPLQVALAINGTIWAVRETFWSGNEERFSAVTPDWVYREGENEVTAFAVLDSAESPKLARFHTSVDNPHYQWGDLIRFTRSGNIKPRLAEGWGRPEMDYTWTDGKRASLVLNNDPPSRTIVLRAKVLPYLVLGKVKEQKVRILVNRQVAGEWILNNPGIQERALAFSAALLNSSNPTVITFEFSNAVSPAKLGIGSDKRELGLAFFWLSLNPQ
jgi:hypothetical protein